MDVRAAHARESHRLSLQSEAEAATYRAQRDHFIRKLREEDRETWTYSKLAREIGCSKELIAHILKQGQREAVLHGVAPGGLAGGPATEMRAGRRKLLAQGLLG